MNALVGYLIIYISIILGSIFISTVFNKKIESCIGIDIILKMIILYIFGLVGFLEIGVIAVSAIAIISGFFALIFFRKKVDIKENVLTYGILFFTFIYFAFMIFTFNKMSEVWDEYSWWSIASKKMFYSNEIVNNGLPILYPPFPTILQYYFTKTIGTYNQGIEIFANIVLGIALLMPLFDKIKSNKKIALAALSIIIICIPAIFKEIMFYQVIYSDCILGLVIGYIFYVLYNEHNIKYKCFSLVLAFFCLTLIKPVGVYIAIILIGVIILYKSILIFSDNRKEKFLNIIKKNKKSIMNICILLITVAIAYSSWYFYSQKFESNKDIIGIEGEKIIEKEQCNSIIEAFGTIKTTLFGSNDDSFEDDTSNRLLIRELMNFSAIEYPFKISLLFFAFLFIAICIYMYKHYVDETERKKYIAFITSLFLGLTVYIIFLQLAYDIKFVEEEAMKHASLSRYVNTYYIAMFILLISIVLEKIEASKKNYNLKYIILTIVILAITNLSCILDATLASGNYNATIRSYLNNVIKEANYLKETLNYEDKIYIVNQESDRKPTTIELKYFVFPELEIQNTEKISKEYQEFFGDINFYEMWYNVLYEDYDYLYIYKTDAYFNEFAKSLINTGKTKDYTLYKIEKNEGNMRLVEIVRENKGEINEKN